MNRRVVAGLLGLALALAGCSLERSVVSRSQPTLPAVELDGALPSIHEEINKENLRVVPGSLRAGHPVEPAPDRPGGEVVAAPTLPEQEQRPEATATATAETSPRPAPFAAQTPNAARPQTQAKVATIAPTGPATPSIASADAPEPEAKAPSVVDAGAVPSGLVVDAMPEPVALEPVNIPAELKPKVQPADDPPAPSALPDEPPPPETATPTPPSVQNPDGRVKIDLRAEPSSGPPTEAAPALAPAPSASDSPRLPEAPKGERDPLLGPNPDVMPANSAPAPSPPSSAEGTAVAPVSAPAKVEAVPVESAPVAIRPQESPIVTDAVRAPTATNGYPLVAPVAPSPAPTAVFGAIPPRPAVAATSQPPPSAPSGIESPAAPAPVPGPGSAPLESPAPVSVENAPTAQGMSRDPVFGMNPDLMPAEITAQARPSSPPPSVARLASPPAEAGEPPPVGQMRSNVRTPTQTIAVTVAPNPEAPATLPAVAPSRPVIRIDRPHGLPRQGPIAARDPLLGPSPHVMPQEALTAFQRSLRNDAGAPPTVLEMTEPRPLRDAPVIVNRGEPAPTPTPSSGDPLAVPAGFANSNPAVDLPRQDARPDNAPSSGFAPGTTSASTVSPIFPASSDRIFNPPSDTTGTAAPAPSQPDFTATEPQFATPHVIEVRRPAAASAAPVPAPPRVRDPLLGPSPNVMPPLGLNAVPAPRRDPAVSQAAFEVAAPAPAPKPPAVVPRPAPPVDPSAEPVELPPLAEPAASAVPDGGNHGLASVPVVAPQPLVLDSAPTPIPTALPAPEGAAVRSEVSTRTMFTIGKPAARVGDEVITLYELRVAYLKRLESMGMRDQKIPEESSRMLMHNVLNDLIDRSLIIQEAKRDLKDPKKYKTFMDIADKVWVEEELAPMLRKHSAANIYELKDKLEERGDSIEELRNQYRLDFLSKGYMEQKLGPKMKVELPEMREYYTSHLKSYDQGAQVSWREVVVEVGKSSSRAEAHAKADALLARLRRGEDFAALAKSASDGPNKSDGGLWKTSPGSYAVPAVNAALESLPLGQISPVLEGPTSFHVVLVEARRSAGPATFAEVQDAVRMAIRREKIMRESTAYLDRLRNRSAIWTAFGDPSVQRASAEGPIEPRRRQP